MTEKEKLIAIFKSLEKLEIKGSTNIIIMHNLFGFIQQEIDKLEKEKTQKVDMV